MRGGVAAVAALGVAVAVFLSSASTFAQDESGALQPRHHVEYESPQHFDIEIRFAPYTPHIDYDPSLNGTPYRDTFGSMARLEVAAEFDWQAVRIPHLGTIGPGVAAGYTSMSAPAPFKNPPPNSPPSVETTSLDIFPFYAVLVLRADVVEKELHIPLVPYVKGGVGYALWRAYNDGGTSESAAGVAGKGHTWGSQVAAGVSLDLNVFDLTAARDFDNSLGVNHTYFFAEYMRSTLTGLGQAHALYVGTDTFAMGLAFAF